MSDIDINFEPNPLNGDVSKVTSDASVKQRLNTIVRTAYYERAFWPNLGCQIANGLFELYSVELTEHTVRKSILNAIRFQEPLAKDVEVVVSYDDSDSSINATITFTVLNENRRQVLEVFLERVR